MFFDGLTSLYVVSALFGLFQGGIVPSYAIIVRETMPAREAATRVGTVIMVSLIGMSFGGWISGVIFDMAGSYRAAFLNGVAWNAVNIAIVLTLLLRSRRRAAFSWRAQVRDATPFVIAYQGAGGTSPSRIARDVRA